MSDASHDERSETQGYSYVDPTVVAQQKAEWYSAKGDDAAVERFAVMTVTTSGDRGLGSAPEPLAFFDSESDARRDAMARAGREEFAVGYAVVPVFVRGRR